MCENVEHGVLAFGLLTFVALRLLVATIGRSTFSSFVSTTVRRCGRSSVVGRAFISTFGVRGFVLRRELSRLGLKYLGNPRTITVADAGYNRALFERRVCLKRREGFALIHTGIRS